jgi:ABC-2 type transport system ATP-binding protein
MSAEPVITARNLSKHFRVNRRAEGLKGAALSLFSRKYETVKAVDGIDLDIAQGEMIGYIGRNGAGKSTTIKMLTGILVPSEGSVTVNGLTPHRKRTINAMNIGVVFGQRTQLKWDIPVIETFRLLREVYQVPKERYARNIDLFTEVLELDGLLHTSVRKLSLGQRMKCDLAAAFLHDPKIIYLDEPTIGLDIVVKERVRKFIKTMNSERGTTVMLTTHDLRDIDEICERAIIIDKGRIAYDGALDQIKQEFGGQRIVRFDLSRPVPDYSALSIPGAEIIESKDLYFKVQIHRDGLSSSDLIREVMNLYPVQDISIKEQQIEDIVKKLYGSDQ